MVIKESAEDYLEKILMLQQKNGSVKSIDIAIDMNYSKPSISRAMKNLRLNGYISVDQNGIINLTDSGLEIAQRMLERHEYLTQLLTSLGVDPSVAQEDACRMEHALSNQSFDAIKKFYEKSQK